MSKFRAWLRPKLSKIKSTTSKDDTRRRRRGEIVAVTTSQPEDTSQNIEKDPGIENDERPPPYSDILDSADRIMPRLLRRTNWDENIDAIRTRVGMPALVPPPRAARHWDTPADATFAAIAIGIKGVCEAMEDPDPQMVAARTLHAIAVAAANSTSHSYLAFVAAATAAESAALLCVEHKRDKSISREQYPERIDNVIYGAVDYAMENVANATATRLQTS